MEGNDRYFWNVYLTVAAILGRFAVAACFHRFSGTAPQGCDIFGNTAWAVFALLRPLVLHADWPVIAAYLSDNSGFMLHLMQILSSLCSLVCLIAG
jgi:hypothetical protein